MNELGPFPVDDVTLALVEHSLDAALTFADDDYDRESPLVVGADMTLSTLLEFLSGTLKEDPNAERFFGDVPGLGLRGIEITVDDRPTYHPNDVIRALIAEVRRLRATA